MFLRLMLLAICGGALIGADRATVLAEILPEPQPAWPPYQIAAHAVALVPGTVEDMTAQAIARQDRLRGLREAHAAVAPRDADERAADAVLAYAFGEIAAREAGAALADATPRRRLELARLLAADADLEPALDLVVPLLGAGPHDAVAGAAARLLAEIERDRAAIAADRPLVPLRADLASALDAWRRDPAWGALRATSPALPLGKRARTPEVATGVIAEWQDERQQRFAERVVEWQDDAVAGVAVGLRLDTAVPHFHLHRRDDAWPRRGSVVIDCHSRHHGAIAFALHRCADHAAWERLDPAIVAAVPLRAWTETFVPLHDCNRRGPVTGSTRVDGLDPGWYVVTARARGAPVVAAQRVAVSAVQLTVLADHRHALVVAIDRATGEPVAGATLAVSSTAGDEAAAITQVTTSADGLAELDLAGVDPQRPLTVTARFLGDPHLSSASATVPAVAAPTPTVQAALWSAVGAVAPGETVRIAGVVRVRIGGVSRPPTAADGIPHLVVQQGDEIAMSTAIALDEHGRFAWEWTVPHGMRPGSWVAALGGTRIEAFRITDADLPPFRLHAHMERGLATYLPGETARVLVRAQGWNGEPVPGVRLALGTALDGCEIARDAITDAHGMGALELRLLPHCALGASSATIAGLAPDGARVEVVQRWTTTDQPFRLELDRRRSSHDPTVGSAAHLVALAQTWDQRPMAGAAISIDGGDPVLTGADGCATLVLATLGEGPAEAAVRAVAESGSVSSRWSYTVRPRRRQQLDREEEIAAAPRAMPTTALMLDEFRPFARAAELDPRAVSQPDWTPRIGGWQARYAIADGAPADIVLRVGARDDRTTPTTALLWASGDAVHAHRLVRFAGDSATVTLPLDRAWAPAARISAVVLDGDQQATAGSTVHLLTPESALRVVIGGAPRLVRPGEGVALDLQVRDGTGAARPGCAVICRVVDLADVVHGRSPWAEAGWHRSLLPAWPDKLGVDAAVDSAYPSTDGLRWWTMGLATWAWPSAGIGRHMVAFGASSDSRAVRQDWRRLALWRPDLVTDADGRIRVPFTVPDRLTTWRVDAWAVADDGALGDASTSIVSRLVAAGSLPLPEFVRAGDRIDLRPGLASCASDVDRAALALAVTTASGTAVASLTQDAAPGAQTRPCGVVAPAGDALRCELTTSVAGAEVDRLIHRVPILPSGERRERWRRLALDGAVAISAARLIDDRRARAVRCTIELEPAPAEILRAAIARLLVHPHGCVEQTLSRFLPAALAARSGDSLLDRVAIDASATAGIARLVELQRADGGWGWFADGAADPTLTALAVEGLASVRDAGLAVPPATLAKGVAALTLAAPLTESRIVGAVDIGLYAGLARMTAEGPGSWSDARRDDLRRLAAGTAPLRHRCQAARLLALAGDVQAARGLLAGFTRACDPRSGERESLLASAEVLTLAALVSYEDAADLTAALYAARADDGASWGDTYVTASVVRALLTQPLGRAGAVPVVVERAGMPAITLTGDQPRVEWPAADPGAAIRLGAAAATSCRMRVEWSSDARQRAPARAARIALEGPRLRHGAALPLTRGTAIELTWIVRVSHPLDNACLNIPLPAGAVVLDGACPGAVSSGMVADGWCAYLTRVEAGEHRVVLRLVAGFAGDLACPPPRLWPMYGDDPGTVATAPMRWLVGEPAQR